MGRGKVSSTNERSELAIEIEIESETHLSQRSESPPSERASSSTRGTDSWNLSVTVSVRGLGLSLSRRRVGSHLTDSLHDLRTVRLSRFGLERVKRQEKNQRGQRDVAVETKTKTHHRSDESLQSLNEEVHSDESLVSDEPDGKGEG